MDTFLARAMSVSVCMVSFLTSADRTLGMPPVVYVKRAEMSAPDERLKIELGTLKFPHLTDTCELATFRIGAEIKAVEIVPPDIATGQEIFVGMEMQQFPPQKVFLSTSRFSFGVDLSATRPYTLYPMQLKPDRQQTRPAAPGTASLEIRGQRLKGSLYVGPLKSEDGSWIHPSQMFAEYFIVTEPSEAFVYDGPHKTTPDVAGKPVVLFPKDPRFLSRAEVVHTEDGRLKLLPKKRGFMFAPSLDIGAQEGLVFGRVLEIRGPYHQWALNDSGIFDPLLKEYGEAVSREPDKPQAYLRRGQVYRQMGDFAKALADYQKAGKPLEVEIATEQASLRVENEVVATLSKGDVLKVTRINGEWLWAEPTGGSRASKPGWVQQQHVR